MLRCSTLTQAAVAGRSGLFRTSSRQCMAQTQSVAWIQQVTQPQLQFCCSCP